MKSLMNNLMKKIGWIPNLCWSLHSYPHLYYHYSYQYFSPQKNENMKRHQKYEWIWSSNRVGYGDHYSVFHEFLRVRVVVRFSIAVSEVGHPHPCLVVGLTWHEFQF